MIISDGQKGLLLARAKYENDILRLLRPYYSYRVFIKFNKAYYTGKGARKDSKHFYGIESICSYNQCLYGHVKNIVLDKEMGYRNCIRLCEEKFVDDEGKPMYRLAQIYARVEFPDGKFNILCREYDHKGQRVMTRVSEEGEVFDIQDPLISLEDNRILYFHVTPDQYLQITEDPTPDFKEIVSKSLNT